MEIESKLSHISMVPGDVIKINVGISYKADIVVMSDGSIVIHYGENKCLKI